MSSDLTIKVVLQDVAGVLTEIDVASNGTVRNMKEKYSEIHTEITVEHQKLVIDSHNVRIALQDDLSISSYNIASDGVGSHDHPILLFVFNQL